VFFVTHSNRGGAHLGDRVYVFLVLARYDHPRDDRARRRRGPPKEMLREKAFVDRVCEVRDIMDGLTASTRAGD